MLGLGAAWFEDEHHAYGFDFPPLKERFERLEDALQHRPRDVHRGRRRPTRASTTRSDGAFNNPRPLRGDIPILIGGSGERKTLRMVAQYADGSNLFGDVERVKHLLGVLEGHCEDVGRDPAEITKTRMGDALHRRARTRTREAKVEPALRGRRDRGAARARMGFIGDPDEIAEQVQAFLDAGPGRRDVLDARRLRPRDRSRSPARRSAR